MVTIFSAGPTVDTGRTQLRDDVRKAREFVVEVARIDADGGGFEAGAAVREQFLGEGRQQAEEEAFDLHQREGQVELHC